ncbi:winged helix DNA-binding domain-containing protein, partial [Gloeophyllum trabeum ATCC 11539]
MTDVKPGQVVPIFLQKLYEIVNNPDNMSLIRWSDRGDSFYGTGDDLHLDTVLDQDRFSREILGQWFKHQKFTSFTRQLNMYGFRKVQGLQQHSLKSSIDGDICHFEHEHFIRGQPELLGFIQRRKPSSQPG